MWVSKKNENINESVPFFIVDMNFQDSNSSYHEKLIIVKCLWISIQESHRKLLSSFLSGKGSMKQA